MSKQKLTAESKAYNASLRDFNTWQMDQNRAAANEAYGYVGLGPESDVAYDTASGAYLNANPYLDQVAGNVSQQIIDQYNKSYIPQALSNYASSGRFGSGLFQQTLADTQSQMNQDVGNAMNNLYYQNYNTERQLQEQARQRIASQYDPLNRYTSYSGILNAYNPGQPTAEYKSGDGKWQKWLGAGGTAIGAAVGTYFGMPAAGAAAGSTIGTTVGSMIDDW